MSAPYLTEETLDAHTKRLWDRLKAVGVMTRLWEPRPPGREHHCDGSRGFPCLSAERTLKGNVKTEAVVVIQMGDAAHEVWNWWGCLACWKREAVQYLEEHEL